MRWLLPINCFRSLPLNSDFLGKKDVMYMIVL